MENNYWTGFFVFLLIRESLQCLKKVVGGGGGGGGGGGKRYVATVDGKLNIETRVRKHIYD